MPVVNFASKIFICCGDNAYIRFDRAIASDSLEFPLLQHPQK
jgi:hypothetical protein